MVDAPVSCELDLPVIQVAKPPKHLEAGGHPLSLELWSQVALQEKRRPGGYQRDEAVQLLKLLELYRVAAMA